MWKEKFEHPNSMDVEQKEDLLEADDVVVLLQSLSFGMETQHPMERAFFFDSHKRNPSHTVVHCNQITMIAGGFREIVVRAFVKQAQFKEQMCEAFTSFAI